MRLSATIAVACALACKLAPNVVAYRVQTVAGHPRSTAVAVAELGVPIVHDFVGISTILSVGGRSLDDSDAQDCDDSDDQEVDEDDCDTEEDGAPDAADDETDKEEECDDEEEGVDEVPQPATIASTSIAASAIGILAAETARPTSSDGFYALPSAVPSSSTTEESCSDTTTVYVTVTVAPSATGSSAIPPATVSPQVQKTSDSMALGDYEDDDLPWCDEGTEDGVDTDELPSSVATVSPPSPTAVSLSPSSLPSTTSTLITDLVDDDDDCEDVDESPDTYTALAAPSQDDCDEEQPQSTSSTTIVPLSDSSAKVTTTIGSTVPSTYTATSHSISSESSSQAPSPIGPSGTEQSSEALPSGSSSVPTAQLTPWVTVTATDALSRRRNKFWRG